MMDFFSFLSYGKYGFYIALSYGAALIVFATLFVWTFFSARQLRRELRFYYQRQDEQKIQDK